MKTIITTLLLTVLTNLVIAQEKLDIGDQLSNFTIYSIDGDTIEIEDLRGKVVYINYFATWCQPCLKEFTHLDDEVLSDFTEDELYFVAIGRQHTATDLQKFRDKKAYKFNMAYNTDKQEFLRFHGKGIPLNIIIDKKGEIIYLKNGYSPSYLKKIKRVIKRASLAPDWF